MRHSPSCRRLRISPSLCRSSRFSMGGGNPQAPDNAKGNVRGLAIRFDLGDGATTDLVMISAPVFLTPTPALFVEFLQAVATGDKAKVDAFFAAIRKRNAKGRSGRRPDLPDQVGRLSRLLRPPQKPRRSNQINLAWRRPPWQTVRMSKKEPADLADKATLFQAYVDLVNSERETIWARHNALLVANSLIVGALAISPTAFWTSKWAPMAMLGAGLLISIAWFLITWYGWSVMRRHAEVASDFVATHYKHLPNPFAETVYRRSSLWIHVLALAMIGIFTLIYLGLGYIRLSSV